MCGAAACALSASMLSHFSITRNVSSPHFFCTGGALSASTAAPYSMQPFSARTAGTLARNASRLAARIGRGDESGGAGAFALDQFIEHCTRLADAQHELAVGEDHVIGVAEGVDLLGGRHHNRGVTPRRLTCPTPRSSRKAPRRR